MRMRVTPPPRVGLTYTPCSAIFSEISGWYTSEPSASLWMP